MTYFTDHKDPAIPEHLRHSYALALHAAVNDGTLDGNSQGMTTIDGYETPATFVFLSDETTQWRTEWLETMTKVVLPDIATVDALHESIPFVTPSLVKHLIAQKKRPPSRPKPKKVDEPKPNPEQSTEPNQQAAPSTTPNKPPQPPVSASPDATDTQLSA